MGSENEIGISMPPVENDVPLARASPVKTKVFEERRHLPDRLDDSTIRNFPVGL